MADHLRFFTVRGEGHFAVGTTNAGYVVAKLVADGWRITSVERTKVTAFNATVVVRGGLRP